MLATKRMLAGRLGKRRKSHLANVAPFSSLSLSDVAELKVKTQHYVKKASDRRKTTQLSNGKSKWENHILKLTQSSHREVYTPNSKVMPKEAAEAEGKRIYNELEHDDSRSRWKSSGRSIMDAMQFKKKSNRQNREETSITSVILRRAFTLYDIDGDGSISEWEFQKLLSGIGKRVTGEQLDHLMAQSRGPGITKAAKAIKTMLVDVNNKDELRVSRNSFTYSEFHGIMNCIKQIRSNESQKGVRPKRRSWCIAEHDNTYRIAWDVLILIVLVYVLLLAPYRIGFDSPARGPMLIFELSLDMCFLIDILIQFRTTYVDRNGRVEAHGHLIASRYFTGYFTVDLLSSVPWDLVFMEQGDAEPSRIFKMFRLVKLTKLGRMAKVQQFMITFKEYIAVDPELFQVYTALSLLLLTSHFLACLWSFAGRYGTSDDLFSQESWQARHGIVTPNGSSGTSNEYQLSLYWAVTTMTTVGFGDVTPGTSLEYAVTTAAMIVGVSFYGYLTAVLTAWFLATDPQQVIIEEQLKVLSSYLKKNNYNRPLSREIKAFFIHFYKNSHTFDEMKMLQQLPYGLSLKTSKFLVKKMLMQFTIFTNVDTTLLTAMLKMLKPQSAMISDEIVKAGEPASTMYMIQAGVVNLVQEQDGLPEVISQFWTGQSFMEYAAFGILDVHIMSAVAVTTCALYGIRASDISELAGEYTLNDSMQGILKPFKCEDLEPMTGLPDDGITRDSSNLVFGDRVRILRQDSTDFGQTAVVIEPAFHGSDIVKVRINSNLCEGDVDDLNALAHATATIRQNVLLLEQFRAIARCSQIGLNTEDEDFEETVVGLMLGKKLEDLQKKDEEDTKTKPKDVNDLNSVVTTAMRLQTIISMRKATRHPGTMFDGPIKDGPLQRAIAAQSAPKGPGPVGPSEPLADQTKKTVKRKLQVKGDTKDGTSAQAAPSRAFTKARKLKAKASKSVKESAVTDSARAAKKLILKPVSLRSKPRRLSSSTPVLSSIPGEREKYEPPSKQGDMRGDTRFWSIDEAIADQPDQSVATTVATTPQGQESQGQPPQGFNKSRDSRSKKECEHPSACDKKVETQGSNQYAALDQETEHQNAMDSRFDRQTADIDSRFDRLEQTLAKDMKFYFDRLETQQGEHWEDLKRRFMHTEI